MCNSPSMVLAGMPKDKDAYDCQVLHLFQEHAKTIERLGWKHMDAEEFGQYFINLLKGLGKISDRLRKSEVKVILAEGKFKLSPSEIHLFADKVASTVRYCKQRLRDCGSGRFLPQPCLALGKIWSRTKTGQKFMKAKAKAQKKQSNTPEKKQVPTETPIREVFGLPPKKKAELVHVASSESSDEALPPPEVSSSSSSAPSAPSSGS